MQLLLSHWHCILPAAAILVSMFFMNRDKSKGNSHGKNFMDPMQEIQQYREEEDHV